MSEVERFEYGLFTVVLGVMAGTSFTCGTVQAEPIDGICQEKMRAEISISLSRLA